MNWQNLQIAPDGTHHVAADGSPAYSERFDDVLKFHQPGLAPVARDERAWHILADGSPAYRPRYRRTFGFYGGLASVAGDDGWHHILPSGEAAYPQRYDWCGNFQGGRCTVRNGDGSYLHIDEAGRSAYGERWNYAGDFRDGIAVVQGKDGKSTHVDLHGRLVHAHWFVDLDVFHKGFARARDEDGWGHLNLEGQPLYARRFAAVEPFYNGQARVERFDGALEIIDERGRTLRELRPSRRSEFSQLSGDMVGFWRTQTIGAAVEVGLPDVLPAADAEVAQRCGLTTDGARRLLRALGELELVRCEERSWVLTPRGEFLRRDHPLTLADAALEYAGPFSQMWKELPEALSAGSGWTAPDVFGQVAEDEGRREGHHRTLRSYAQHDYPLVAEALELREGDRVIDAGGGVGALARMLREAQPSSRVTVLDRPEVVEIGRREVSDPGIHWRSADLFEPWDVQADAVILSRVLHDWDDADALRILQRAREALSPGGRVFIVEMLVPEGGVAGAQCDLHLLMATGGRERSRKGYERLLVEAGFELAGVRRVAALRSIVMGVTA